MSSIEGDDGDLTRKQRREQARTERKAMEEAAAAAASRRTRLTQLGVVVAVVVVAIVVILIATGGSGTKTIKAGTKEATATASSVETLIAGIPQNANVLGKPDAPVTLQYYGDLECPFCKAFTIGALPKIIEKWVRSGKLRIEYHSLETATREPETFRTQQVAALAAGKQAKMWNFVELFYHEQGEEDSGYVTEKFLQGLAEQIKGLDLAKWTSDRADSTLDSDVTNDAQTANDVGFTGTPSFLIGKTGGASKKLEPTQFNESGEYDAAIEKLLKS